MKMVLEISTFDGHYNVESRMAVATPEDIRRFLCGMFGHCTPCDDMSHVSARLFVNGKVVASAGGRSPNKVADEIIAGLNLL